MDSSTNNVPTTPRRSVRLQRQKTPEPTPPIGRGPQAYARYNRGKKKMNKTLPTITVTSPIKDPVKFQNEDPVKLSKEDTVQVNKQAEDEMKVEATSTVEEPTSVEEKKQIQPVDEEQKQIQPVVKEQKQIPQVVKEQKQVEKEIPQKQIQPAVEKQKQVEPEIPQKDDKPDEISQKELPDTECKLEPVTPEITQQPEIPRHETYAEVVAHKVDEEVKDQLAVKAEELLNTTPNLMDESVISVPESIETSLPPKDATFSPEPNKSEIKDSTFSPIADKSLHDSRPHIDVDQPYMSLNITPLPRNITQRTSTPLAQKIIKRDTPKVGSAAMSSLAKVLSPRINSSIVQALNDTVNGQFKLVNPLERSILKSTRKRSLSVAEGESFVQKKVMFISPKVMDIGEIDERMMQSYIEEKENSRIATKGTRRKRSLSASEAPQSVKGKTPPVKKIPDFKAIHEARFARMETLDEYQVRKAQRAKKLLTPSKSVPVEGTSKAKVEVKVEAKVAAKSKIPKGIPRKPLVTKTQENPKVQRPVKRSMSAEPQSFVPLKKPMVEKPPLSRAMSQDLKETSSKAKLKFPPLKAKSQANLLASKTEERREKNMALYKSNVTRTGTGTADIRKKNENILKGVRLNRRFELLMQNRAASGSGEHADT